MPDSFRDKFVIMALIAVVAIMGINNYLYARGDSAGPGCGGCGRGAQTGTLSLEVLEERGLQYYLETTGDREKETLEAAAQDFGCHQEVYIYKNNQLVMTVGFGNGRIYRIY